MTLSNEVKVALLAIMAIALSFWGYKFILGKNVLKDSNIYYVEYQDVDLMKTSSPVTIGGVQIGFVSEIKPLLDRQMVLVTLDLDKDIKIPKSTVAIIEVEGFMGGKSVTLQYDEPCSGDDCAQSGDYLRGVTNGMLASMMSQDELDQYLNTVERSLGAIADTLNKHLLSDEAEGPLPNSLRNLEATLANLEQTSGQLNSILYRSADDITGTMDNLNSISANLQASNEKIASIIDNTDKVSGDLADMELQKTLQEVDQAISQLRSTLNKADQAFVGINGIVGGLEAGEGTLGKLLKDGTLYEELSRLSSGVDSLAEDFQDRPYRYMPLKSRRKVKRYDRKDENSGSDE